MHVCVYVVYDVCICMYRYEASLEPRLFAVPLHDDRTEMEVEVQAGSITMS
jgi:hypothetical protein